MKPKFQMPDGEIRDHEMPEFKTPYNHDRDFESERTGLFCKDPSLTKQEFKEESDINVILERFMRGGDAPPPVLPEHFADLTGRTTYYEMSTKIAQANETFYKLDAQQRAEHLNDPNRWADAVVQATQRGDREALRALGLDVPPEKPLEPPQGRSTPGATPVPENAIVAPEAPKGAPKTDSGK